VKESLGVPLVISSIQVKGQTHDDSSLAGGLTWVDMILYVTELSFVKAWRDAA
jgi:hypothetical protein